MKTKKRQTTLKANVAQPSVRITKKDQAKLVASYEDFCAERYAEVWAQVTKLRNKLAHAEKLAYEFGRIVAAVATPKK